jgi:hypothetical protein
VQPHVAVLSYAEARSRAALELHAAQERSCAAQQLGQELLPIWQKPQNGDSKAWKLAG